MEVKMIRLSQIAVPLLGAAVGLGIVGCAKDERHAEIPPTAAEVSIGSHEVAATATRDSDVYIYDATSGKMVYTGRVNRGQMVKVEAERNRVTLDGQTLTERDLNDTHRYKIFFDTAMMDQAQPAAQQYPAQQQQPSLYQVQPVTPSQTSPPAQQTTPPAQQTTPAPAQRSY
jgi:hypothetical protein